MSDPPLTAAEVIAEALAEQLDFRSCDWVPDRSGKWGITASSLCSDLFAALRAAVGGGDVVIREDGTLARLEPATAFIEYDPLFRVVPLSASTEGARMSPVYTPVVLTEEEAASLTDYFFPNATLDVPYGLRCLRMLADRIRAQRADTRPIQQGDRVRPDYDSDATAGTVLVVYRHYCWVLHDDADRPYSWPTGDLVRVPVGGDNL